MAIFPTLEHEAKVQVNDKTRISGIKTYADKSGPAIVKVEIQPYAAGPWIEVTNASQAEWYTDYQYDTDGTKVITLKINGATTPVTSTSSLVVLSVADDALFSSDADLTQEEPDILKYVKKGRNTFKDVHREAQKEILDLLDRKGYKGPENTRLTAQDAVDKEEVRTMSKYLALHFIFSGISNVVDDVFSVKSKEYYSKYLVASDRRIIGFDLDGDGEISPSEGVNLRSARMIRR